MISGENFKNQLIAFFEKHDEMQLKIVDDIAKKFRGNEDVVLEHLCKKYKVDPESIGLDLSKLQAHEEHGGATEGEPEVREVTTAELDGVSAEIAPPKKSKKKLMIILIVAILVLGGAFFMFKDKILGGGAAKEPEKEAVKPEAAAEQPKPEAAAEQPKSDASNEQPAGEEKKD